MNLTWQLKNLARRVLGRRVQADPAKAPLTPAVEQALALPTLGEPSHAIDPELAALVAGARARPVQFSSRELFSLNGQPLPAWREEDTTLEDDWVTTEHYYPLYHRFFQETLARRGARRLLEIGVRTGYVGLCFARAVDGRADYLGVDPNLYLPEGLDLARASFAAIERAQPSFSARCLLGYSDNPDMQAKLHRLAPFDLIHVDGDHTLRGKLIDLDLCRRLVGDRGLVLVDDYTHIPSVIQESVARALHLGWYKRFAVLDTKRGLALLAP